MVRVVGDDLPDSGSGVGGAVVVALLGMMPIQLAPQASTFRTRSPVIPPPSRPAAALTEARRMVRRTGEADW
jgi:hypothetical protein